MKKFFAYFFLIVFCISAAVADSATVSSRSLASERNLDSTAITDATSVAPRVATTRGIIQKPVLTMNSDADVEQSDNVAVRNPSASRAGAVNQTSASARTSASATRATVSRSTTTPDTVSPRDIADSAVRNVGRSTRDVSTSVNNNMAVRRTGLSLRSSAAEVGSRPIIAETDIQTRANVDLNKSRAVQSRAASNTKETIAEATERLQQTASLNKSCQEQYNDCMDQFCSVIDANQKRCSCSANLSRYTKVEAAVKDANSQLNDVAQRIRYIGLSADEIRAIMSATEAELTLSGTRDNTESRNMLEEIEKLIKNPSSATTYTGDTYSGLDMDLDFSSDASDLFSLDFLGNATASFSNLRGTELYNAAKKRCNTVLNQCKGAGATVQQITGNYDLAIDKDCIAYEQGLSKMNDTLKTNVRSANQMLQKARLAVLQNKNQYDAKGCIAALNTCMTDDMVCGADYTKCLDPTKKYIDENGTVILGRRIADITDFMENYNNAAIDQTFLSTAKNQPVNETACKATASGVSGGNDGSCIVRYLLEKIGTGATVSNGGLCRAVLDKCQRVSYNQNGTYMPYNEVVVNYTQRALVNIQAAQKQIISDYASNCMVDIASCYNQQVSQVNAWSSTASINSIYNVMRGACRNVALTCAYAVFAADETSCPPDTGSTNQDTCINSVSEMFYQSLLCPDNSSYQSTSKDDAGSEGAMYVNDRCKCDTGYEVWGKTCSRECAANEYRENSLGSCKTCSGGTYLTTISGNKTCETCSAGYYCPAGATSQTKCPVNNYCSAGVSNPTSCPVGTTSSDGSSSCTNCPSGSECPTCPSATPNGDGNGGCIA